MSRQTVSEKLTIAGKPVTKSKLIGAAEAAQILNVGESSVRRGECGTGKLTRIRPGNGKKLLFVRTEVERLVDEWIANASDQKQRATDFMKYRRQRAWLK